MKKKNLFILFFCLLAGITLITTTSCKTTNTPVTEVEEYTVTFNSKGGSAVSSQTVKTGEKAQAPTAPTREGYEFRGWYTDEAYTNEWKFDVNTVSANTTLYAKWEEKSVVEKFTITFDSNGGSTVDSVEVEKGNKLAATTPTKENYTFEGWYKTNPETDSNAVAWNFETDTVTEDTTLYAKWKKVQGDTPTPVVTYSITYVSDHGTKPEDVAKATTLPDPLPVLSETGWEFKGWYTTDTFEETSKAVAGAKLSADATLYAKWEKVSTPPTPVVTYSITYISDHGTKPADVAKATTLPDPLPVLSETGWEFKGWYTTNTYTESSKAVAGAKLYEDVTLYAKWEEVSTHTLTLIIDNQSTEIQVNHNGTIQGVTLPSKIGYDLELFTDENHQDAFNKSTIFTSDLTLYGSYKIKTYTVTFKNGNTVVRTETVNHNSNVTNIPAGPTKTGYTFDGWSTSQTKFEEFDSTTKITSSITLYACYTIQKFEVKFMDGSVELSKQTIEYNSTAALPGDPTRTGYIFKGWSTKGNEYVHFDPNTKITKNTIIYAYFVAEYTVTFNIDGTKKVVKVEENTKVAKPEDPSKSGYRFDGWLYNGAPFDFDTFITENIELVANFTEVTVEAIEITNSGGYNEGLFFEATPITGVSLSDYTVQYKLSSSSTWKNVDSKLIREQGGKIRCDVIGLPAGSYQVKIDAGGKTRTISCGVLADDRSGYAHFNYSNGIGAYNNDGTLKSNAVVVYVTDKTKNTVEATIGGKKYTGLVKIIQACTKSSYALNIRILGEIQTTQWNVKTHGKGNTESRQNNLETLFNYINDTSGWDEGSSSSYSKLNEDQIISKNINSMSNDLSKGITKLNGLTNQVLRNKTADKDTGAYEYDSYYNMLDVSGAYNITIEGIGTDAAIFQWGFAFKKCNSIEIKNLRFHNYTEDAVGFEGGKSDLAYGNYWVHNCTFDIGVNNWDVCYEADKGDGDGSSDVKYCHNVTISNCQYNGTHKTNLIGSGDSALQYNITLHHNYYNKCGSRLPLVRQANVHMYNNYYYGSTGYSSSIRANSYAFVENCYYDGGQNPYEVVTNSTYTGTAIKAYNNIYNNVKVTSNSNYKTGNTVQSRTASVSSSCKPDGKTSYANFDTNSSLFYYKGSVSDVSLLLDPTEVPEYCKTHSGVLKSTITQGGGDTPTTKYSITYVSDYGTKPANVSAATTLPNPLPTLSETGYQFLGWYTTSTYTESSKAVAGASLTGNVTLYAKWKENQGDTPTSEAVTITFDELKTETVASSVTTSTGATVQKGGSTKDIKIAEKNQTINGTTIKKYVSVGGGGNFTDLSIAFTTTKTANITIYYANPGSDARFIALFTADGIVNQNTTEAPVGGSITQYTYTNMAAGNYATASKSKGLNIYMIVIEYLE